MKAPSPKTCQAHAPGRCHSFYKLGACFPRGHTLAEGGRGKERVREVFVKH